MKSAASALDVLIELGRRRLDRWIVDRERLAARKRATEKKIQLLSQERSKTERDLKSSENQQAAMLRYGERWARRLALELRAAQGAVERLEADEREVVKKALEERRRLAVYEKIRHRRLVARQRELERKQQRESDDLHLIRRVGGTGRKPR